MGQLLSRSATAGRLRPKSRSPRFRYRRAGENGSGALTGAGNGSPARCTRMSSASISATRTRCTARRVSSAWPRRLTSYKAASAAGTVRSPRRAHLLRAGYVAERAEREQQPSAAHDDPLSVRSRRRPPCVGVQQRGSSAPARSAVTTLRQSAVSGMSGCWQREACAACPPTRPCAVPGGVPDTCEASLPMLSP